MFGGNVTNVEYCVFENELHMCTNQLATGSSGLEMISYKLSVCVACISMST